MKTPLTSALVTAAILALACGRADNTPDRDNDDRGSAPSNPADVDAVDDDNTLPATPGDPTDDEPAPVDDPTPPPEDNEDEPRPEPPPGESGCEAQGIGTEGACTVDADGTIYAARCGSDGRVETEYCGVTGEHYTDGCAIKAGHAQCVRPNEVNFRREEPWFNCYDPSSGAYAYTLAFSGGAVVHFAPDETMTEGTFEFFDGAAGVTVSVPGFLDGVGYVFGELDDYEIVLDIYGDGKECYVAYYEDTPGIDTELYCDSYNPYLDTNYAHTFDFDPWGAFTVTEIGEFGPEVYYGAYFIDGERVVASYYASGQHQFDLELTLLGDTLFPVNLEDAYDFFCD